MPTDFCATLYDSPEYPCTRTGQFNPAWTLVSSSSLPTQYLPHTHLHAHLHTGVWHFTPPQEPVFAVRDCVMLKSFLRFTPLPAPSHAWRNLWTAPHSNFLSAHKFCALQPELSATVVDCTLALEIWNVTTIVRRAVLRLIRFYSCISCSEVVHVVFESGPEPDLASL